MPIRLGYGRLACACNNRPYIVPIYFVYDDDRLYCFSTLGRKIEWMRENPLVCVEADEVRGHDDWTSVIVLDNMWKFRIPANVRRAGSMSVPSCKRDHCGGKAGIRHPRFAARPNSRSLCTTASRSKK